MKRKPALLATADGRVFRGTSSGAEGVATGEAVFNTSMTGYQEILTDPSYAGQVVVMTSPHIGNYGVSGDDAQSDHPHASGLVVRSMSRRDSNWRSTGTLGDYLVARGVVALSDVDTRSLTRHLRDRGAMPVAMGTGIDESELIEIAARTPSMEGRELATEVSTTTSYRIAATSDRRGHVVAMDLGTKRDIVANLARRGYDVTVMPARSSAEEILDVEADGLFLSNGPGDPAPLRATAATVRELIGKLPILGICLGHQVLGLALGAATYKLPFGHHGGNHPVRRLHDGQVEITSQNHGFAVDLWSLSDRVRPDKKGALAEPGLLPDRVETAFGPVTPTHQNLNDGTLEGMELADHPVFSVQYHPEAAPGPRDAMPLFDRFTEMMEGASSARAH